MRQTFRQFSSAALAALLSLTLTQARMGAQEPQVAQGTGFAQESADATAIRAAPSICSKC